MAAQQNTVNFDCNICDTHNISEISSLTRETASCSHCGSTVRMRSIVQVLTTELFGKSLAVSQIDPPRPDLVGIGMSCWDGYVAPLSHRVAYKNTYYHQEPRVDITNIDPAMVGTLDFIVSSDVFEHVESPVDRAFVNARRLLKPGGVFILTVPYFHPGQPGVITTENFPDIYKWEITESELGPLLKNTKKNGEIQYFYDLVYHGGPGSTLEMRRFSEWSVIEELKNAGFDEITVYRDAEPEHGIYWPLMHSAPISARVTESAGWRFQKKKPRVIFR